MKRIHLSHCSRLRPLHALTLLSFASAALAAAPQGEQVAEVQFNDGFLQQFGGTHIDVSRFDKGNVATPGSYVADLYVNQIWLGRTEVTLRKTASGSVEPCFDKDLLERIGVDLTKLSPEATAQLANKGECTTLPQLINDASASFDNGELRLDISVPQAAMNRQARGYVDPKYWDDGVTSAMLQYNANAWRSQNGGASVTQGYLGLTAGVNVGPWRFRHSGNLSSSSQTGTQSGTHYQAIETSLQRAIAPLKSALTIGDAFTDGTMFDSVGFRGVQLASDIRMYPDSQRGYAPIIRGTARTNARVQVQQNGNVLYETNVAPGPFEINDLYATGYGGNLQVVVTEADGSQTISVVPYAAAPNALRPGVTHYSVTAGEYRSALLNEKPLLFQATVQHGFTNLITGYGGVTVADGYLAAVAGAALNTRFGAFGMDITQSDTRLPQQVSRRGQSLRLSYSKFFAPTDTNISVAAYRYSSSGFLSLENAIAMRATGNLSPDTFGNGTPRNSAQVTLNQRLPQGWGTFYLSGTAQNYWSQRGTDVQFQAGYNNVFKRVSYGISLSRQLEVVNHKWDNRVMLTASVPLGIGAHTPFSSTSVQHDSNGLTSVQQTVSGTLGENNAFSYSVNGGYSGGGTSRNTTSAGGSVSYRSLVSTLAANASTASGYSQYGAGASGTVVAYGGGIVMSPATGDTMAIVEAKDAAGAQLANQAGLRVDHWGHALVPGLTPFSRNEIGIDPKGLPVSVELKSTSQHVAPTAGAIVRATFETDNPGASAIIRTTRTDGQPMPFGADVFDAAGQNMGTVAQGGRIIVRGLKSQKGELSVRWADGIHRQECRLSYSLPDTVSKTSTTWTTVDSVCQVGQVGTVPVAGDQKMPSSGTAQQADNSPRPLPDDRQTEVK
ncbi:fimbria/pilus outer membrane usher protein [Paraburkholderia antibiotica]|uniref:Fimbrial biogenesis outer membrane usher protein n=1 Tax=Paraburkholderia antibiotica TaxID=2728839 RepID=A0A7X9ZZX5_9BURK|nr:fimbria/pilus outer membrane usher protein [Paraburkholderia antibiotica]NML33938.1 fimbrial biogenesis outer membrane usher protein [Paraburkholderia antibiotica]